MPSRGRRSGARGIAGFRAPRLLHGFVGIGEADGIEARCTCGYAASVVPRAVPRRQSTRPEHAQRFRRADIGKVAVRHGLHCSPVVQ